MDSDNGSLYSTLDTAATKAMARLRSVSADGTQAEIVARLEAQNEATGTAPWKSETGVADPAIGEASTSADEKSSEDDGFETVRRGKKTRSWSDEVEETVKSKKTEEVKEIAEDIPIDAPKDVDDGEKTVNANEPTEPAEIPEVTASSTIEPEVKTGTIEPMSMKALQDDWDSQWGGPKPVDTKEMRQTSSPKSSFAAIAKQTSEKKEAPPATIAEPISASSSTPAASNASTGSASRSNTPATDDEVVVPEKKEDAQAAEKPASVQEKEESASSNGSQAGEPSKKKKRNRGGKKEKAKKAAQLAEGSQASASSDDVDAVRESEDIQTPSSPAPMESSEVGQEATESVDTAKDDAVEAPPEFIDVSQPADINNGAIVEPSPSVAPTEVEDPVVDEVDFDLSEHDKLEDAEDLLDPSLFNQTRPAQDTQEVVKPSQPAKKMAINPIFLVNVGKKDAVEKAPASEFFPAAPSPAPSSLAGDATSFSGEPSKRFDKKSGKARKAKANAFVALADEEGDGAVEAVMPGDEVEHAAPVEEEGAEVVAVKKTKKCGTKAGKKVAKKVQVTEDGEGWKFNPVHFGVTVGVVGVLGGLVRLWMKG